MHWRPIPLPFNISLLNTAKLNQFFKCLDLSLHKKPDLEHSNTFRSCRMVETKQFWIAQAFESL